MRESKTGEADNGRQASPRRAFPAATLLTIGVVLSLLYGAILWQRIGGPADGKLLYTGARLLTAGQNPYDVPALREASHRLDPGGALRLNSSQSQLHLPATLAVYTPLSWLTWSQFYWLQMLMSVFSIPLIVWLCMRYLALHNSIPALWFGSLGVAVLPATYQNLVLGQIALPVLLAGLLTAWALETQRWRWAMLFTLLALLKFTCTLPLLFLLFLKHGRKAHVIMVAALGLFVALNAAAVARIGVSDFLPAYRASVAHLFMPGAPNDVHDPRGWGQRSRVDLESLLAVVADRETTRLLKIPVAVLLLGGMLYGHRHLAQPALAEISAALLLALLMFYHRTYDTVLLIPACFLSYDLLRRRDFRLLSLCFILMLALYVISVGHSANLVNLLLSPFGMRQPHAWKAFCLFIAYIALVTGVLLPMRQKAALLSPTT